MSEWKKTRHDPRDMGWFWLLEDGEFLPEIVRVDDTHIRFTNGRKEKLGAVRGLWQTVEPPKS